MKNFIFFLGLLCCLVGCREDKEFLLSSSPLKKIMVTPPRLLQSRVQIENNGQVFWSEHDQIGVFSDIEPTPVPFTFQGEKSGSYVFEAATDGVKGDSYYAFSPYASFNRLENNTLFSCKLPSEQNGVDYMNNLPMVAQVANGQLSFLQTCGLIRLSIVSEKTVGSIELRGNNGELLSGIGHVDVSSSNPVLTLSENKESFIRLAGPFEPDESGKIQNIYFIVPPQNFAKGITIKMTLYDVESSIGAVEIRKKTENPVNVVRGTIASFTTVDLEETLEQEKISEREALIALYDATNGEHWTNNTNWCTDAPLDEWYGVESFDGQHVGGLFLPINNLDGVLPDELINLQHLQQIQLDGNNLQGEFPVVLCQLPRLHTASLYNNEFTGVLPVEVGEHNWDGLFLGSNRFYGDLPENITDTKWWQSCGFSNFAQDGGGFNIETANLWVPDFTMTDIKGGIINPSTIASYNKFTIVYVWTTWCLQSTSTDLYELYNRYKQDLAIIGICDDGKENQAQAMDLIQTFNMDWYNVLGSYSQFNVNGYPTMLLFDQEGKLVFHSGVYSNGMEALKAFLLEQLGEGNVDNYESTDFSKDKTYETLQVASIENGIDVVLMGDAFSDRQIEDGTYRTAMERACQAFFSEEPYKSFKNYFNVYYVNAVSKNEGYVENGETVFETFFGEGTYIGGNDEKCIEYAKIIPDVNNINEVLIITVLNSPRYAGTASLYLNDECKGDYGQGLGIAYCPTQGLTEAFDQVIIHEAGGHAFAKLGDEYILEEVEIPIDVKQDLEATGITYGWYKNNDTQPDPYNVKWSKFIEDDRYKDENISVYEGAFTYATGVFRPTENSVMNENTGGFNAPSREAIYMRIQKLVFGASWQYDYEDFVKWDKLHRSTSRTRHTSLHSYPRLHAPVVKVRSF